MRDSELCFEEVAASDLTYGPAEKSRTVVADFTVIVRWLVSGWAVARPATPGIGCARRGEGFGEDFGSNVTTGGGVRGVCARFDAALYVVAAWTRPGLVGGVSLERNVEGRGGTAPVPGWKLPPEQPLLDLLRQKPLPAGTEQEISTQHFVSISSCSISTSRS